MDIRRIVRPNASWSSITTVIDLEAAPAYQTVRDSWVVTPPQRKPQIAAQERRYGGARTVGETHDNGTVAWTTLVSGTDSDDAVANLDALIGQLEQTVPGLFVEWRPDGTTVSGYFEIRGPGTWKPNYTWAQFAGARSLTCEIQFPVAPLVRGAPTVQGPFTLDLPGVIELDPVPGSASALLDVKITPPESLDSTPDEPAWVLLGWSQRPTASGTQAPFGVISGGVGTEVTPDAFTADYVAGSWRDDTVSAPHSHTQIFTVRPSRLPTDMFADGERTIELWGRFELASNLVNPRAIARCCSTLGVLAQRPTLEFGEAGRDLVVPSSGTAFRFTRLGTLVFTERDAFITVETAWDGGTGPVGLDYVIAVPSTQRAVGPTGKSLDDSYPSFFPVGAVASAGFHGSKVLLSDLSGYYDISNVTSTAFNALARHTGLGGSPLEVPPGDVDLLLKASLLVPDDPTSDASTEQATHPDVEVYARVWPRWPLLPTA